MGRRRVGIVGFGKLGQYLLEAVLNHPQLEVAFVWNRTKCTLYEKNIDKSLILDDLSDCVDKNPDLIVEVAHPVVVEKYGYLFLKTCDFMLGSPTALADKKLEETLFLGANNYNGLYIPSGALWGADDIRKMAELGTLKGLTITMTKHPSCFKVLGDLQMMNDSVTDVAKILYEGPVRPLCSLAPNNVNTMAAAAIAGINLGLDKVIGKLIADPRSNDWHTIEIEVVGPKQINGNTFKVQTVRSNPADKGVVTGKATYHSFLSSVLRAKGKGIGVHLC